MPRLVDLSRVFDSTLQPYPGDLPPLLRRMEESGDFIHYELHSSLHSGTHVDAPHHRYEQGKLIYELPLERFCGPGVLIDGRTASEIGAGLLPGPERIKDAFVFVCTGSSATFGTAAYFSDHKVVTPGFAQVLADCGAKALGVDAPSPDRSPYPVHEILLAKEVLIIENLTNLEMLAGKEFEVLAFPPRFRAEAAPVRVVARIEGEI